MVIRAIDNSFKSLSEAFKQQRELRDDSVVIRIYRKFLEEMGGVDELGRIVFEDFGQARENKKLALQWHGLLQRWAEAYDKANADTSDLANVDQQDLEAHMKETAVN